jgi:hypothetical protein
MTFSKCRWREASTLLEHSREVALIVKADRRRDRSKGLGRAQQPLARARDPTGLQELPDTASVVLPEGPGQMSRMNASVRGKRMQCWQILECFH